MGKHAHPLLPLLVDGTGYPSKDGRVDDDGRGEAGGGGVLGKIQSLWQVSDIIARISGNVTNRMDDYRLDWSSYLSLDVLFLTAHLYICSPLPTIVPSPTAIHPKLP